MKAKREAVPSLKNRPPDVMALVVPGRFPFIAVVKFPRLYPVMGRLVPGQAKPETGRPEPLTGLIILDIDPGRCELVVGLEKEVPGRGAVAREF